MQIRSVPASDEACSACSGSGECPRCAAGDADCRCHGSGICGECLGTGTPMELVASRPPASIAAQAASA
jgi:hypothetical protein